MQVQNLEPKLKDFETKIEIPVLVGKSFLSLNDVSELEAEIENLKSKEYNNSDNEFALSFSLAQNAKKADIEERIKNYASIKAGLKCTKCAVCSDLFCESREVEIESLECLQQLNEDLDYINVEDLKLRFELNKVNFETEKRNKIAELEAELKKVKTANEKNQNLFFSIIVNGLQFCEI